MKYFARLDDALLNRGEIVTLCSIDKEGNAKPLPSLYPVPAIPERVAFWPDQVFVIRERHPLMCNGFLSKVLATR